MVFRSFDTSPVRGLSRPGRFCCAVISVPISAYLHALGGKSGAHLTSFNTFRFNVRGDTIFFRTMSGKVRPFGPTSVKVRAKGPSKYQLATQMSAEVRGPELAFERIAANQLTCSVSPRTRADIARSEILYERVSCGFENSAISVTYRHKPHRSSLMSTVVRVPI
jgi:hypothetical protein